MTAATAPSLADLAPAELAELVIETLRQAARPLSVHATAEALLTHNIPQQRSGRAECIHTSARTVGPALDALLAAARVRRRMAGGVYVYEPTHPTADVETRINVLEAALGGRKVRIIGDGTDPVVQIMAPLSRIEAIGR
jgi:N-methylhydantoinase B/oxoprolinase/acetone carboxylase alpha subunit